MPQVFVRLRSDPEPNLPWLASATSLASSHCAALHYLVASAPGPLFLVTTSFLFHHPRSRSKDWHLRILFLFTERLCSLKQLGSFLPHPTPTFLPSESICSSAMIRNRPTRKATRALGQARAWTTPPTATLAQSKLPATQRTKVTATASAAP